MAKAKGHQRCLICRTIPDEAVELWIEDRLVGSVLPEAASRLKIIGAPIIDDLDSCLKHCPECGTFYGWTYKYDFLKGTEDEFILTRLSEAEGQRRLQVVIKYIRENTSPVEHDASADGQATAPEPSPARYPAMAALVDKTPLALEVFADVLAQHRVFIDSGGGGVWETFRTPSETDSIIFGVYQAVAEAAEGTQADLSLKRLDGLVLRGVALPYANLCGVWCRGQNLRGANLEGILATDSDFTGSNFHHATLAAADFSRAELARCDFRGANLSHTDFERADLSGADLRGATLDGASFLDATMKDVLK